MAVPRALSFLLALAVAPCLALARGLRPPPLALSTRQGLGALTCTSLTNQVTHFTARIQVGTPPQDFDVVADTGSDSVIISSCLCRDLKRCNAENKCFTGTNRSTTFFTQTSDGTVPVVVLTFGSGQVEAIVSSDVVRVGSVQAKMDDGLLLMVDQALRLSGPFEGILGLGLPRHEQPQLPAQPMASAAPATVAATSYVRWGAQPDVQEAGARPFEARGFLEAAGVGRFSMCFNDGSDGVLRLEPPTDPAALGSVGQVHWGLDFRGISVGNASAPVVFCSSSTPLGPGQVTPCGAIPDSGTTIMMGPAEHVRKLFAALCDGWERCRHAMQGELAQRPKEEVFQLILLECSEWMTKEEGLKALPSVHVHLRGSEGHERTLEIPASTYVLEALAEEAHYVTKHLLGIFPVQVPVRSGKTRKVCTPAFGVQEYTTVKNGPVWILGTPIFYEYQVGYDMQPSPPTISFNNASCGTCSPQTSLFAESAEVSKRISARIRSSTPRMIRGPLVVKTLDTRLPL
mmetsp:Transcript_113431/g.315860  ORF Transcript_113431/g.315860 Transcript_113431/m.315860 type:complete len:516 (-) Transcript_113431:111-1658(-)